MKPIGILFLLLCLCTLSIAQTAIQTSFETSDGYNAGNLNTQNGWTVTSGTAVVSTAKFKTGTQSINPAATATALKVDHNSYGGSVPGLTGEVYVDMWVYPTTVSTKNFAINGFDLYGSSQKRIFVIEFTTDNKIRAFNGSSSSTTNISTWTANQWVRISVKIDFATEKYQVAVNGTVYGTQLSFRETYTPTASGTRVATTKEYHLLRFNHLTDTDIATSDVAVDDLYIGKTPIAGVPFSGSSSTRTITVTQPAYGTITLNPSQSTYQLNDNVTATLTLPQGYKNNGWTGDLSGTALVQNFTVTGNMSISANTAVDPLNPPPTYTITVNQPANGTITLSPVAAGNVYYKETVVTATVTNEACYQFNNWTGDLSGTQTSKTFTVQNNMTISADIVQNNTAAVKRTASTVTEFKNALAAMNPGDTIEVNNGTYNLSSYTITRSGCSSRPIVIMAKNKGGVILNGATALVLRNLNYVTLQGFIFQSTSIGTGVKMENCTHVRITQNIFNYTETASCTWVYIGDTYASTDPLRSGHNRVDHNIFDGKTEAGNYIRLDGNINQQTQYDTIDHNLFKNNGPRATNEKESIRIGVSTLSASSGFTVVEYNLFQDCDGDPEVVSVKSRDNIIRYNTFQRCLGTLCIRQSFRTTVEGNYFFGEGKTAVFNGGTIGCGGIRVYGKDHKIINNYFHGLTGEKWDAAITITNGDVTNSTGSTTEHNIPENVVFAYNTLYNNKSNIEIGFNNSGNYPLSPVNCTIANNIIVDNTNPIVKSYSNPSLAGVSFSNNIFYPTQTSSVGITATAAQINTVDPQLVQPTCTGANCNASLAYQVFRLNTNSPAIDAGTGSYPYVTLDFEQQTRTANKDIGAHEYKGSNNVTYGPLQEQHVGPDAVDLTYGYTYGVLPVKLIDFNVKFNGEHSLINWIVAAESNMRGYEVEWSSTATDFISIANVPATGSANYTAKHFNLVNGVNYYRLKMINKDGSFVYSSIISVNVTGVKRISVYPNPAKSSFTVNLSNANGSYALRLVNTSGITVKQFLNIQSSQLVIPTAELPAGVYQLQIIQNNNSIITRSVSIIK